MTGGASGLGQATVKRFIREGAKVVLCDLPTSDGQEIAKTLGNNCAFAPVNVSLCLSMMVKISERKLYFTR